MEESKKELEVKELSDEQLNNVTGGNLSLAFFDTAEKVRYIFFIGDIVKVKENIFSSTVICEVRGMEPFLDPQYNCYVDLYIVRAVNNHEEYRRVLRDDIVNMAD